MPRLRNIQTGATVSVSDETAARLGAEWEQTEEPAPKAPAKKAASAKKSSDK